MDFRVIVLIGGIIEKDGVVSVLNILVIVFKGFIISITLCETHILVRQIGNLLVLEGPLLA